MSLPYHRGQVNSSMTQRGSSSWGLGSKEHKVDETNRNLMEADNGIHPTYSIQDVLTHLIDAKWAELGEKVSLLKEVRTLMYDDVPGWIRHQLGLEINQEVKSQNRLLDGMVGLMLLLLLGLNLGRGIALELRPTCSPTPSPNSATCSPQVALNTCITSSGSSCWSSLFSTSSWAGGSDWAHCMKDELLFTYKVGSDE